jgi:hypothetical protein
MAAGGSEPGAIDDLNQSFEGLEEEEEREGDIGEILSEGGRRRVFSKVNVPVHAAFVDPSDSEIIRFGGYAFENIISEPIPDRPFELRCKVLPHFVF